METFGERYEPSPRETISEVLRRPSEAINGDLDAARIQSHDVIRRLMKVGGGVAESGTSVSTEYREAAEAGSTPHAAIDVTFPSGNMLQLTGIFEGRGAESGLLGFKGRYGKTKRNKKSKLELDSRALPLEELFDAPSDAQFIVRPTANRWAIGKDAITAFLRDNIYTFYMGLGFLLLDEGYMLIGSHEAGHIYPKDSVRRPVDEENDAWKIGLVNFKRRHGKTSGSDAFGLVKPARDRAVTIGDIIRFGLTSHYIGGTKLPTAWRSTGRRTATLDEFKAIIEQATQQYGQLAQDPNASP